MHQHVIQQYLAKWLRNSFAVIIFQIFGVFSIIFITAAWDSPLYRAWGSVLVLCANSAIFVRTLPPVVMQLKFNQAENTPINQVRVCFMFFVFLCSGVLLMICHTQIFLGFRWYIICNWFWSQLCSFLKIERWISTIVC